MKRKYFLYAVIILAFAVVGSWLFSEKKAKILVVLREGQDITQVRNEIENLDIMASFDVKIVATTDNSSYNQILLLEEEARQQKWDYIIIDAIVEESLKPIVRYLREKGSIVIGLGGTNEMEADFSISPWNLTEFSKRVISGIVKDVGERAGVLSILPENAGEILSEVDKGCLEYKNKVYPFMHWEMKTWDTIDSAMHSDELLAVCTKENIQCIVCYDVENLRLLSSWKDINSSALSIIFVNISGTERSSDVSGLFNTMYSYREDMLLKAVLEIVAQYHIENEIIKKNNIFTDVEGYEKVYGMGDNTFYGNDIMKVLN